jgi:hypothetical protein
MSDLAADLAALRLRNTQSLFAAFVASTVARAAAADVRGLEKLFAGQLRIAPSYWSQLKSGQRHIGAKLARQFETLSGKPAGWLDAPHPDGPGPVDHAAPSAALVALADPAHAASSPTVGQAHDQPAALPALLPESADERFVVGLFLAAYRRDPQSVRRRLLDMLDAQFAVPTAAARRKPAAVDYSRVPSIDTEIK